MKKWLPFLIAGLGLFMVIISMVLRQGTADADIAITNVTSSFMLIGGSVCIVVGLVTYFLRHNDDVW
jgi:hypothetical protein